MSHSNEIPSQMQSRSKPVRVLSAAAAGLGGTVTILAALVAAGVAVPVWIPIVVGGAATLIPVVVGEYIKDQVTPWEDVVSKKTPTGQIVAGPASTVVTGAVVKDAVKAGPGAQPPAGEGDLDFGAGGGMPRP